MTEFFFLMLLSLKCACVCYDKSHPWSSTFIKDITLDDARDHQRHHPPSAFALLDISLLRSFGGMLTWWPTLAPTSLQARPLILLSCSDAVMVRSNCERSNNKCQVMLVCQNDVVWKQSHHARPRFEQCLHHVLVYELSHRGSESTVLPLKVDIMSWWMGSCADRNWLRIELFENLDCANQRRSNESSKLPSSSFGYDTHQATYP